MGEMDLRDLVVLNFSITRWGVLAKQRSFGRVKDTTSEIVFIYGDTCKTLLDFEQRRFGWKREGKGKPREQQWEQISTPHGKQNFP
jgi:hypothetical protein